MTALQTSTAPSQRLARARRAARDRGLLLALVCSTLVVLGCLLAPLLTSFEPDRILGAPVRPPSATNPFGTDEVGRDVFTRLLYAGRSSLVIAFLSTLLAAAVGVTWGLVSGYLGRWWDAVSMRLTDALLAFPSIILALITVAVIGTGTASLTIAIALVQIPQFTRLVRGEVLAVKGREFVLACRVQGASAYHIIRHAILPNVAGLVIVQFTLTFASAILIEAGLSFLGLGVQPPSPSWGSMLNTARQFLSQNPIYSIVAGLAIFAAVFSFSSLGIALTRVLDARSKR